MRQDHLAYRLTSHSPGGWRYRRALRTMHEKKITYFIPVPAQKWARIVLRATRRKTAHCYFVALPKTAAPANATAAAAAELPKDE